MRFSERLRAPGKLLLSTGVVVALASIVGAGTAAAAAPACFGAAARDPRHPCINPTLTVTPGVGAADPNPGPACSAVQGKLDVCRFGSHKKPDRQVAVIGDSHVFHWRTALSIPALQRNWRAYSIIAPGCIFSDAARYMFPGAREPCMQWNRYARQWFGDHPEVDTVFATQNADTPLVLPAGKTEYEIKVAGFKRTYRALPKNIKHVIVLRDTPASSQATLECVLRALDEGTRLPGPACPLARSVALRADRAVSAVKALHSERYRYIDMSPYFCSPRDCYPVIGGALVNSDIFGHITMTYASTLGPYLLRRLRGLTRSW